MDGPGSPSLPVSRIITGMLVVILAAGLTLLSAFYQRPDPAFCRGLLGAGLPAPFVCDASGESPLSSVGQIDWADTNSPSIPGVLADVIFYGIISLGAWRLLRRALHRRY